MEETIEKDLNQFSAKEIDSYIQWALDKEKNATCVLNSLWISAYSVKRLRNRIRKIVLKLEGGEFFSKTLREIYQQYHNVTVGMYSYGWLSPNLLPEGTKIGNYCSLSNGLGIYRRNHPLNRISQHAFFYNSKISPLKHDTIENDCNNPLIIGNDVWLANGIKIMPSCKMIGDGAIVGSLSVVTKDVEPYTIVAGNPACFIRRRFPKEIEEKIIESKWWVQPLSMVANELFCFANEPSLNLLNRFVNHFSTFKEL